MKFQILFKSLILLFAGSASCQSFFAKLAETWSQWTGLSASNNRAISDERCYGSYGCFSSTTFLNNFPQEPEKIQPTYCLFTRLNISKCHNFVKLEDLDSDLYQREIKPESKMVFIIHGYSDSGNFLWRKRIAQNALKYEDTNAIVVNWENGYGEYYNQAVANIKLIGVMLAHLIIDLNDKLKVPTKNCHLVGHSLGAQLAGYTGQYLRSHGYILGRITGLDPANPSFKNAEPSARLDHTDAHFVDVIHSDVDGILFGFGLLESIGHIDYYPNGGAQQPGCSLNVLDSIQRNDGDIAWGVNRYLVCSHLRAIDLFTESFHSICPFLAVKCSSYSDFLSGRCQCNQDMNNCFYMGYKADQMVSWNRNENSTENAIQHVIHQKPEQTRAYLITSASPPFCQYHYRVTIVISNLQETSARGSLLVQLNGDEHSSPFIRLNSENVVFQEGKSYSYVVGSSWLGSSIVDVSLVWTYAAKNYNPFSWFEFFVPSLRINRIIVSNLETRNKTVICGRDLKISSESFRQFYPNSEC